MSFVVNTDLVRDAPADWADLLKPEYAGSVALPGDPRASNQAILARVCRPASPRGAEPARRRPRRGSKFFTELNEAGNFVPVIGKAGTLAQGATPIVDLLGLQRADRARHAAGQPAGRGGRARRPASSPASTSRRSAPIAPHPNAAKLWMEYLYSDEGQLKWLKGYCHPIRFNDLVARGVVPQELLDKLPPAAAYETAVFPTLEQTGRRVGGQSPASWDSVVGANVAATEPELGLRALGARPPASRWLMTQSRHRPRRPPGPGPGSASCRSSLFALLFLILPTMHIVVGAFRTPDGRVHASRTSPTCSRRRSSRRSGSRSASASPRAFLGCLIGFAVAAAVTLGGLPRWLRGPVMTFSGVASNFAGVPLAFAFLATLGRLGLVTVLLREWFGINLYALGFNLLSFWGLTLTYLFFQIPLMILIITPALDGLKREWREAAEILGASPVPVLAHGGAADPLADAARHAGAALRQRLRRGGDRLRADRLVAHRSCRSCSFAQIRGDVLGDPHLGYALAFGMIVVTGIGNALYIWMRTRAERWIK